MRPPARRTIYNGRGLPREELALKFARAAERLSSNICHTVAARDCALICRPRDDFLEKCLLGEPGCRSRRAAPTRAVATVPRAAPGSDGVDKWSMAASS